MGMLLFVIRRVLSAIPAVIGVTILVFGAIKLVPGDPVRIRARGRMNEDQIAEAREELGLNDSVFEQYADFVTGIFHGDLGTSITQGVPVAGVIFDKMAPSLFLLVYAVILSVSIALPLAFIAVARRGTIVDHIIKTGGVIGFAMPSFWIGLLLILALGLYLRMFPIAGYGEGFLGHLYHLFLPSLTIAISLAPILVQSLRASMLEVLDMEFVEVARAKGLSEMRILYAHVVRNALIPFITVLSANISFLLSGTVTIEYLYAVPGLGSHLLRAISYRDYPTVQGVVLVFAVFVVIVNILADVAYAVVDKRVTHK
jgi:ABC-type dipeptide/oligopeptide/nickel transport system permease component